MAPILSALASAVGLSWNAVSADAKAPAEAKALSRDRSPSECSTAADSEGVASGSEGDRQPSPRSLERNTVIIFDWDDTLLPTSCIRDLTSPNPSKASRLATEAQFRRHAVRIEAVLRAARAVAHVSIVTLSKRTWVPKSAEKHLPGLDLPTLLRELGISVYYAQEESPNCPGALAAEDWMTLKRSAMAHCLDDWHAAGKLGGSSTPLSVVSVGDALIEQRALQTLIAASADVFEGKRLLCKTVKLMDRPSLEQLGKELRDLPQWLQRLAAHDKDVDVTIESPLELATKARAAGL